jgi:hypothetical protein
VPGPTRVKSSFSLCEVIFVSPVQGAKLCFTNFVQNAGQHDRSRLADGSRTSEFL